MRGQRSLCLRLGGAHALWESRDPGHDEDIALDRSPSPVALELAGQQGIGALRVALAVEFRRLCRMLRSDETRRLVGLSAHEVGSLAAVLEVKYAMSRDH